MVLPRINNAAKNAPSWVVIIVLPNLQQVGHDLPYLQQVWFIYTKLAVSMAAQAILGAFPAALQSSVSSGSTTKFSQFRQHWQHGQFRQFNKRRIDVQAVRKEALLASDKTLSSCGMDILWYGYARQRGVLTSSKDRRKVLPCVIPRGQCCVAFRICKTARR